MKNKLFLLLLCLPIVVQAQQVNIDEANSAGKNAILNSDTLPQVSNFKRHSIYAELGGNSFYYSVNYDYLFRIYKDIIKLATGTGTGYIALPEYYSGRYFGTIHFLYFTPEVNFLFGKKSHYLETGTALWIVISDIDRFKHPDFRMSARVGYRYQPQKGGFLFRFAYTPFVSDEGITSYLWFGISFGYIF